MVLKPNPKWSYNKLNYKYNLIKFISITKINLHIKYNVIEQTKKQD